MKKSFFLYFLSLALILFTTYIASINYSGSKDELWDYPAGIALQNNQSLLSDNEITLLGYHIPIATGPYQGAYKSYIIAGTTALFGTSPLALKSTNLLLAILFMGLLIWSVNPKNYLSLALILFFPIIDFNLLSVLVTDYGPSLIQCIGITLAIGSAIKFIDTNEPKYLLLIAAGFGITINGKITSAPELAAISLSLLLLGFRQIFLREKSIILITSALFSFLITGAPFLLYLFRFGLEPMFQMTGVESSQNISFFTFLTGALEQFNSDYLFNAMSDYSFSKEFNLYKYTFLILLVLSIFNLILSSKKEYKVNLFLILTFVSSIVFQTLVPGLNRPWHYYILYPILITLIGKSSQTKGFLSKPILCAGVLLLCMGTFTNTKRLIELKSSEGVNLHSPSIFCVNKYLSQNSINNISTLNYSLSEPLYVYSGGSVNANDLTWQSLEDKKRKIESDTTIKILIRRTPTKTESISEADLKFLGLDPKQNKLVNQYFNTEHRCTDKKGTVIEILKRIPINSSV